MKTFLLKARLITLLILSLTINSCIVVNNGSPNPYNSDGDISMYKPVPLNRTSGEMNIYNLNGIHKIRASGIRIEIMKSHKNELETKSNYMQYLQVLRYGDELFIFYDFPRSGPDSGFHNIKDKLVIYTNQSVDGIVAQSSAHVTVRDLMFTPSLSVHMEAASHVKCDVNTQSFSLSGNSAAGFEGWVETPSFNVSLTGAAVATVGGTVGVLNLNMDASNKFTGENMMADDVKVNATQKSSARIGVKNSLTVNLSNQSKVYYRPYQNSDVKITQHVDGSSFLERY